MMHYYVAASLLVLVITLAGYFINESQGKRRDRQLGLMEHTVEKYVRQRSTAPPVNCYDNSRVITNTEVCQSNHRTRKTVSDANAEVRQSVEIQTPLATLHETDTIVKEEVILPVVATVPDNNSVEPIIGVIIPQKKIIAVVKERKFKIRLFKIPDNSIEQKNTDPTMIFARIN
jgi:hypothetical protein